MVRCVFSLDPVKWTRQLLSLARSSSSRWIRLDQLRNCCRSLQLLVHVGLSLLACVHSRSPHIPQMRSLLYEFESLLLPVDGDDTRTKFTAPAHPFASHEVTVVARHSVERCGGVWRRTAATHAPRGVCVCERERERERRQREGGCCCSWIALSIYRCASLLLVQYAIYTGILATSGAQVLA